MSQVAHASPFDPSGSDWEGLSELILMAVNELGRERVVVTNSLDVGALKREDGVLLVHPQGALDVDELSSFMRAGGRVVLLDDFGTGEDLLSRYAIRRVALPTRPAESLRGNPALAVAVPADAHPLVRDVSRVITNHGTGVLAPSLSPLLVVRGQSEPDVLVGLAGSVAQGRLVVVGDGSIAINSMLRYPGNRAFALALVRYATEDDTWGTRGGRLYVLVNDFRMTGSFGSPSGTSRRAVWVAEARRQATAAMGALATFRRQGAPPLVLYLLALGVALGLIVWTSAHAGKSHRPRPPRFVLPTPIVAQGGVAGHAAVLGAPGTSRVLAMLEWKSALEEELATRAGLDRAPPHDQLIAKVREAGLLDEAGMRALSKLLTRLSHIEMLLVQRRKVGQGIRNADVAAVAAVARDLLDTAAARSRYVPRTSHGNVSR
ncbi:MAG: DUF4350 domain-containing protein [Myxococcota bacterium]|nr:DUF4350 domain-containing protein [Myxococcota bacterium]